MIRRGRTEGWLKLPVETAFRPWAELNGVDFNRVRIGLLPGSESRGSTVIAEQDLTVGDNPLITVPRELILSLESVEMTAKSDKHLKEVLDSLGEFGRTTRGAVLVFLLMQAMIACPEIKDVGLLNPLADYIKFLPLELLPTFWTDEEQDLLQGTTLKPAVGAKLKSLQREFNLLKSATQNIGWCAKYWWDEENGQLTLDDWMQVDAMYRSRALEFPGIGDCMVPCVDMANHSSGDLTGALYETDSGGNGLLLLREGKDIEKDEEITITYGDEKGACEMIFSYGFLEESMFSAKVLFLELEIPDDDPLRPPKLAVNTAAPGVRIYEKGDRTDWESDFLWLACTNEEDGLEFKVLQTNDGGRELSALWKGQELDDTTKLKGFLAAEDLWEVYQLRAVFLLQNRVEAQLQGLADASILPLDGSVREIPWQLAGRLHELELALLQRSMEDLEDQKTKLLQSAAVQRYLGNAEQEEAEEDFT